MIPLKCFGEYEDNDLMYMKMISMKWFGEYEDDTCEMKVILMKLADVYWDYPCKMIWSK